MSDTRKKALGYLKKKGGGGDVPPGLVATSGFYPGDVPPELVATSRFYPSDKSWTQKEAWWFDLPIKRIKANKKKCYYLLGAKDSRKSRFVVLRVPNNFLLQEIKKGSLEIRYQDNVRLHLAAYKKNWLVDERGRGRVDFSRFEMK